tara:strand:+ start:655 stop:1593 length:939 start_codon:yes stop_codon:yes gene_type:complete
MVYKFSWTFLILFLVVGIFFQNVPLLEYYKELSSFKLLWILDQKNNFKYWCFTIILYIPIWVLLKVYKPKILDLSWVIFVGFSGILFMESTFYSRVAFSIGLAPLLWNGLVQINALFAKNKVNMFDIRRILTFVFALVLFVPGLYAPPFFDGISGWTFKEFNNDKITFWRLEAFDSEGNILPFPYACFSPLTQEDRMYSSVAFPLKPPYLNAIDPKIRISKTHEFFQKTFLHCLEYMKDGLFPYQRILGKFAYPTHNLSNSPDKNIYRGFHNFNYEGVNYVEFSFIKGSNNKYHELPKKILATFTSEFVRME